MSQKNEDKDSKNYITIEEYLTGNSITKIKQIHFIAYDPSANKREKAILGVGQDFISYSKYQDGNPVGSPTILNSKDSLVYADRNCNKISIKQIGQENPVLIFSYSAEEVESDIDCNSKADNPNINYLSQYHTHIEQGGEGGTPGMKEK
jgi:hypothetical protein